MAKSAAKALSFWAYLTLFVSLLAALLPSLRPHHPHSSFLDLPLPLPLRRHYASGKLIKAGYTEIFTFEHGPTDDPAAETVILLHGLGSSSFSFRHVARSLSSAGLRAISIDLPFSGFSSKLEGSQARKLGGFLGRALSIYAEIREKGIFWGFDQLVETGQVPEVEKISVSDNFHVSEMANRAVGQVLDEMSLRQPVHLVLHDFSWSSAASWVSANQYLVSSVTLLDSSSAVPPAFPFQVLEMPMLGDIVLWSRALFGGLIRLCCFRPVEGEDAAEVYRVLMKDVVGKRGVLDLVKGLNYSFDLEEWAQSEALREVKIQVLWSNSWTDRWIEEGRRVAEVVPQAKFAWHSGGRWPQEDAAEEIAEMIANFVLSLPKSTRHMKKEAESQRNEESGSSHHHGHGHEHAAGYYSTYGRGQEWGT